MSLQVKYIFAVVAIALFFNGLLGAPADNEPEEVEDKQEPAGAAAPRRCVAGYRWTGQTCVHRVCEEGNCWNGRNCTHSNVGSNYCVRDHYWNGGECVRTGGGHNCRASTYWNGRNCTRDLGAHHCTTGYYWNGLTCTRVSTPELLEDLSALNENNEGVENSEINN